MNKEIIRKNKLKELKEALKDFPIASILGPRQCGKTTLAHQYIRELKIKKYKFYDLENPLDFQILRNPLLELENKKELIVIDEIQEDPDLFPVLRVLADKGQKFIILGSASPKLLKLSSESLAGRVYHLELSGFSLDNCKKTERDKLWIRGGFPLAFLAKDDRKSLSWREEFIKTFLERDIPQLGIDIPARALRRFWMMLAHYHGQIFKASEIAKSLDCSDKTARSYLDILTGTYMIRELQPWFYNTKKRLVKRPKIYFRDSGIFHALMNISSEAKLKSNPKLGASWEGFALEETIKAFKLAHEECFFWNLHSGAELDLVFMKNSKLIGCEFKYSDAPKLEKSMLTALEELDLEKIYVIYPGKREYALHERVAAKPLGEVG